MAASTSKSPVESPTQPGRKIRGRLIYTTVKRLCDVLVAGLALLILAGPLLVIAALVALTSPGGALYRGQRTGLYGRPFYILKFRSMVVGSDQGAGTTSRNDARVTPVGRILRRYKLDEMPQLINVLRGDMSFVGPRPELPRYTSLYSLEEQAILSVRPGITDLASIRFNDLGAMIDDCDPDGNFEANILPEKNRLRLEYVHRRGFWLDIHLIFKTVGLVLARPICRQSLK